jgi:2-oxoglutarate ferredoxin oxidoreductase subunit delta
LSAESAVKGRIEIDKELCKGCGLCITVCPKEQIEISEHLNKKGYYPARFKAENAAEGDDTPCTGCALCGVTCPDVAIEVYKAEKDPSKGKQADDSEENSEQG